MNQERFEQVLAAIDAEQANGIQATLDMGNWAYRKGCNTTLCLAGWASVLAGDPPKFIQIGVTPDEYTAIRTVSGRKVRDVAQEWLEMKWGEEDLFFSFATNSDELRQAAAELIAELDEDNEL